MDKILFVGFTLAGIFHASLPLNCILNGSLAMMSMYLLWLIIHTNLVIIVSPHYGKYQYYSQERPSFVYF